MGKRDCCLAGPCNNDKSYPDKIEKRSHVVGQWNSTVSLKTKREDKNGQQWYIKAGKTFIQENGYSMFKSF